MAKQTRFEAEGGVNSPIWVEQEREKTQNMPSQDDDRLSSSSYTFYCSSCASIMGFGRRASCLLAVKGENMHYRVQKEKERLTQTFLNVIKIVTKDKTSLLICQFRISRGREV